MTLPTEKDPGDEDTSRWALVRDVAGFQIKLLLDSLRDVLLSPVSILAALAGILTNRDNPGVYFYRLREFGHKTDRWINLFNVYDENGNDKNTGSADSFLKHAENIVLKEYEKGGALNDIKEGTDRVIDRLNATHEARRQARRAASDDPSSESDSKTP